MSLASTSSSSSSSSSTPFSPFTSQLSSLTQTSSAGEVESALVRFFINECKEPVAEANEWAAKFKTQRINGHRLMAMTKEDLVTLLHLPAGVAVELYVALHPSGHTTRVAAVKDVQRWPAATEQPPVFQVRLTNSAISPPLFCDSELLLDQGNMRCDLLLPAHDALKLGLQPQKLTKSAKPVDSAPIIIRYWGAVIASVVFPADEFFPTATEKMAPLDVYVSDRDFAEWLKERAVTPAGASSVSASTAASASSDTASSPVVSGQPTSPPPLVRRSPIKYMGGTSQGRPLLGKSGMRKLKLRYSAESNTISSFDVPEMEEI